jgi:hypothetical protein
MQSVRFTKKACSSLMEIWELRALVNRTLSARCGLIDDEQADKLLNNFERQRTKLRYGWLVWCCTQAFLSLVLPGSLTTLLLQPQQHQRGKQHAAAHCSLPLSVAKKGHPKNDPLKRNEL